MFNPKGKIWLNINFEYVRRRIQLISEVIEFVLDRERSEIDRDDIRVSVIELKDYRDGGSDTIFHP